MLAGLLIAALPLFSSAFTKHECLEIAENAAAAQHVLNTDPAALAEVHALVKKTPAEELGFSEKVKEVIVGVVDTLKPGGDPQNIGSSILNSCLKTVNAKQV